MAKIGEVSDAKQKRFNGSFLLLLLLLGGTLAVLCRQGFLPYEVFWANDIPLGPKQASSSALPGAIFAAGSIFSGSAVPTSPFHPICPTSAWRSCRRNITSNFTPPEHALPGVRRVVFLPPIAVCPMVCVLGGLGAGLNMHFLSNACWGLGQWNVCCGMIFIALGILVSSEIRPLWLKGVLAGLSTGMAVMEGFDVGAILSIYVGVFLAFLFLTEKEDPPPRRAGKTLWWAGWWSYPPS
jgi:hypothetical protein